MAKNPAIDIDVFSKAEYDYTDEYYLRDLIKEHRYDYLINAQGFTATPSPQPRVFTIFDKKLFSTKA